MFGICDGRLAAPFDAFLEPERQKVTQWIEAFQTTGYLPQHHP
jgi:hypothetical protein